MRTAFLIAVSLVFGFTPAAAMTNAPENLHDAIRLRTSLGFRSDVPFISSVEANQAHSREYGAALTADEVAEVKRRIRVQSQLRGIREYLAAHPAISAGFWINHQAGGLIEVRLTSDVARHEGALTALAPNDASVRIATAAHSLATLIAMAEQVVSDSAALRAQFGLRSVGVDIQNNRIDVGLDIVDQLARDYFAGRYDPSLIHLLEEEEIMPSACSVSNCPSPNRLRAAMELWNGSHTIACTTGLLVRKGSNTHLLTASHCFNNANVGVSTYHAGQNIGAVASTAFYQNSPADAMIINISDARESNWHFFAEPIIGIDLPTVGTFVCRKGITSGGDCGLIDQSISYPYYEGIQWINQARTNFPSKGGDSGGPVYADDLAYGLHDAHTSTKSYFSRVDWIESTLNVQVCVDLSCVY